MATQYTSILKFALPVTGELSGTWGDVVNNNITSMVEQAIAGLSTINTWTANAHTLTVADGTTSESRCAMLVAANGSGGTALSAAGEIICPAASKLYVLKNGSSYAITLKTAAGTGVAVPSGDTAFLFCDGTNVNSCVTTVVNGHISGNLTVDGNTTLGDANTDTVTVNAQFNTDLLPSTDNARDLGSTAKSWRTLYCDTSVLTPLVTATNLQVTNIKANDGTAAMAIADSTGAVTVSTILNVDNLRLDGNTLSSTDSNGNVVIAPNGTGDVQLDADTVRIGDSNANATLTTNGTGDLILNTNSGTNSGSITIQDGVDGNIIIAPNGNGQVQITNAALDLTTIEVSNINAKDGTAAITIADSTGAVGISTAVTMSATTQNIALGTSQTSGTFTVGGAAQTGALTLDQSTKTHTLNLGTGATESGLTKTINLGTGGVATSTTAINIGSANGTSTTLNGTVTAATLNSTTVDTTNLEVTNIKAKDGTAALSIADSTGAVTVATALTANGGAVFNENGADVDFRVEGDTDANLIFADASTDRVGIGTNTPGVKLDIAGNATVQNGVLTVGKDTVYDAFINSPESMYFNVDSDANSSGNKFTWGTDRTGNTGGTTWMTLDSSGNLGLGVTPSAWNSNRKAIQTGNASLFSAPSAASYAAVGANVFNNSGGTDTYISSAAASLYLQNAGVHSWYTAPSGTANTTTITNGVSYTIITSGNQTAFGAANNNVGTSFTATSSGTLSSGTVSQNISFTQAMTLDASGNLLVGQTSSLRGAAGRGDIEVNGSSSSVLSLNRGGAAGGYIFCQSGEMRVAQGENSPLTFYTSDTERARITSGGYFKASNDGTYPASTYNYHEFSNTAADLTMQISNESASNPYGIDIIYTAATPNGTGNRFLGCYDNSGVNNRLTIRSNGGIANYQANDVNLSDRREKTNFAPAKSYLDTICAIPVQTFNYIDQSEDDPGLTLGVVAQDVQAVAPELVMESNWGTKDDPKMRLSIYQTDLQYALMKCIQELKAQNDELRARVAQLEAK